MTRDQFDKMFAARHDNTAGYTTAQLRAINDRVFEAVRDMDADTAFEMWEKSRIDREFELAFAACDSQS